MSCMILLAQASPYTRGAHWLASRYKNPAVVRLLCHGSSSTRGETPKPPLRGFRTRSVLFWRRWLTIPSLIPSMKERRLPQPFVARCKLVLVGDVQCGKTAMLQVLAKDCYPEVRDLFLHHAVISISDISTHQRCHPFLTSIMVGAETSNKKNHRHHLSP